MTLRTARLFLLLLATLLATFLAFGSAAAVASEVRFATFNVAMGLAEEGELARRLATGDDDGLQKMAAVLQRMRPDVVLINEFDWQPGVDAAEMLQRNYLSQPQRGHEPIRYEYAFSAPVNTGVDSGLDLDQDGELHGPGDAWGWGRFPGQYGMLVLSRFPIERDEVRTFQKFLWKDMPGATQPRNPDGTPWYPPELWQAMRLSSKSHWDLPIRIGHRTIHLLAAHPTPPGFDGPEDRNGARNHDEIRLWADYVTLDQAPYLYDDEGRRGGLREDANFVIAGDLNASKIDGGARPGAIDALLDHAAVNATCIPRSRGAMEAAHAQGGANAEHQEDPAMDTGDFSDERVGNLRADYVLPSANLEVIDCGVFWPASDEEDHELVDFSDHRLVWIDLRLP